MRVLFVNLAIFFLWMSHAYAWTPHLTGDVHAPDTLLVVDKQNQNFLVLSNKSPLQKEDSWQCTTGQAHGDKLLEGDLKTPEGIYFLERRISANLPYELYGELAFTLNYPNPVDRINAKTGHSIWIHGRGRQVVPFDTEGCVAMDMEYMLALERLVELGRTPVIMTETFSWEPVETFSEDSFRIVEHSLQWAGDWQTRSEKYFEHYEPVLYSKSSGQSFSRFEAHKKQLFDRYQWLDVFIEYPRVIKGPDYWVSYFGQVFKAPGYFSVGVKRLYWKKDESGLFRIVGEEWRPLHDNHLEQKYLASREKDLRGFISNWRDEWLAADLDRYASFYHEDAVQNNLRGKSSIIDHKVDIWSRGLLPKSIDLGNMKVSRVENGFEVEFEQSYSSISGYSDYGIKTLLLAPFGRDWLIISESWSEIR